MERYRMFVDGGWADPTDGRSSFSVNPATAEPWAEVPEAGQEDVDAAIGAADRAFQRGPWPSLTPTQRGALLRRLGDLVAEHAEELAVSETRDNGKAIRQTRGEMAVLPHWFWYYAGAADKIQGSYIPMGPNLVAEVLHEPIGVTGAITPFNSPLLVAAFKVAPALAAGNTVVLKPAPETPVTSLRLAELAAEAGFPPGVFNVVPGGDEAGRALVANPVVGKIAFTGESTTARAIAVSAADTLKRVSLEGGGKSPHIVFADANIDQALISAAAGVFISAGQTCVAGSRLLIQNGIYEEFVERLAAKANSLRVGDPTDPSTHIGAMSSELQLAKVKHYVELAKLEGAEVLAGGTPPIDPALPGGYFFQPTVIVNASNDMRVCQDEIFGPIAACLPFSDEEEALQIANAVPYDLAGGVWTNDIRRAHRVARALQVGTVWVNNYRTIHWQAPFGGLRQSGYGRESGLEGMREYLQTRTVISDMGLHTADPFED